MTALFEELKNLVGKFNSKLNEFQTNSNNVSIPSKAYINWGVNLAKSGDVDEAIKLFESSSQMGVKSPESFINWGIALAQKGEFEQAIEKFRKAAKLDRNSTKPFSLWGAALVELGDYEQAERIYGIAISLDSCDIDIYINWGIALARQGKKIQAEEKFKQALEINKFHPQAMFLYGAICLDLGKYSESVCVLKALLGMQPTNAEAFHYVSLCLKKMEDLNGALEHAKGAVSLNPSKIEYHINLAESFAMLGDFDKANECYKMADKINSETPELLISKGVTLQKQNKHFEAVEFFDRARQLQPNNLLVQYNIAISLSETGKSQEAAQILEHLIESSDYKKAYSTLGRVYNQLGNYEKALESFETAIKKSRKNTILNFDIACIYLTLGDLAKAVKYLKITLEHHPDFVSAHLNLAKIHYEMGEGQEAIRKIRSASKLAPESKEIKYIYGVILSKNQKYSEAIEKFDTILTDIPEFYPAHIAKSKAFLAKKQFDKAEDVLNNVLQNDENNQIALFLSGLLNLSKAEEIGDNELYKKALEYYERLNSKNEVGFDISSSIGYIKAKLGIENSENQNNFTPQLSNYDIIYNYLMSNVKNIQKSECIYSNQAEKQD